MQTVDTELETILGGPSAIEEAAHAQIVDAEPDLKLCEQDDPNANTPYLVVIATTHRPGSCQDAALAGRQSRDARTRPWRGFGAAAS